MRVRVRVIGLLVIVACCLSATMALAGGIGVTPSKLELTQAMRGGQYDRTILIMNPGETPAAYAFETSGDAGGWITFHESAESTEPIDRVTVPAEGRAPVIARFTIPEDAASGAYEAAIIVVSVPADMGRDKGSKGITGGAAVLIQARAAVHIEVTGTQILAGAVDGITAEDTEVDFPLRINVHFENTGNVTARPEVAVSIFQGQALVEDRTFSDANIKPGSKETIPLEWSTKGQRAGEYTAKVTVSLGDETIATEEVAFELLPAGTMTREGQLVSLAPEGEPAVGSMLKMIAIFANTGQIETLAKFVGEIYRDGVLIDTLESQERLVLPKNRTSLASYVKIDEPGAYTVKGQVNFGGKLTDMEEVSLDIAPPGIEPGASAAQPGLTLLAGGVRNRQALLLIAGAAFVVLVGMIANSVLGGRGKAGNIS